MLSGGRLLNVDKHLISTVITGIFEQVVISRCLIHLGISACYIFLGLVAQFFMLSSFYFTCIYLFIYRAETYNPLQQKGASSLRGLCHLPVYCHSNEQEMRQRTSVGFIVLHNCIESFQVHKVIPVMQ